MQNGYRHQNLFKTKTESLGKETEMFRTGSTGFASNYSSKVNETRDKYLKGY